MSILRQRSFRNTISHTKYTSIVQSRLTGKLYFILQRCKVVLDLEKKLKDSLIVRARLKDFFLSDRKEVMKGSGTVFVKGSVQLATVDCQVKNFESFGLPDHE